MVGPEVPLVAGIADLFAANGLPVFGLTRGGAQLEGSKAFAKESCTTLGAPPAATAVTTSSTPLCADLEMQDTWPLVVKADGLAAGKGVVIADDFGEARAAVRPASSTAPSARPAARC